MASGSIVDDNREEHRMLMRLNDISPILARLIIGEEHGDIKNSEGILRQKVHDKPYTITLYAMLKDYGMTPINRIKPRVRFSRKGYDDVASGSPVFFPDDASVDFVEFKYRNGNSEVADPEVLQKVFADGTSIEDLAKDPVALLVAQHDTFLMQPPVKKKSKVASQESGEMGIPLGEFLEALNNPSKTRKIFGKYKYGKQFAKDLLTTLEPFMGLEFEFGIYSRYRRWDCMYVGKDGRAEPSYRTTFDPFTVLGWIRNTELGQQLQPLANERSGRWEHKINPAGLDDKVLRKISDEIRKARHEYLIPRCLSKSQTALTLLGEAREAELNLLDELANTMTLEMPLRSNKYSDIEERKSLRAAFNRDGKYRLHKDVRDIVEKHQNLAIAQNGNIEYVLNNAFLSARQRPFETTYGGVTIRQQPKFKEEIVLSAQDLRDKLPSDDFDRCYSRDKHECGYIVRSMETGRCFTVSFGRKQEGSIGTPQAKIDKAENYLAIKYLGIVPDNFRGAFALNKQGLYLPRQVIHREIIAEMRDIVDYLKHRKVV